MASQIVDILLKIQADTAAVQRTAKEFRAQQQAEREALAAVRERNQEATVSGERALQTEIRRREVMLDQVALQRELARAKTGVSNTDRLREEAVLLQRERDLTREIINLKKSTLVGGDELTRLNTQREIIRLQEQLARGARPGGAPGAGGGGLFGLGIGDIARFAAAFTGVQLTAQGIVSVLRQGIGNAFRLSEGFKNTADQIGSTIEEVQVLDFAFRRGGQSIDEARQLTFKLNDALATARAGNTKTAESFFTLGLSLEELNRATPGERLALLGRALRRNEGDSNALAAAIDLLGTKSQRTFDNLKSIGDVGLGALKSDAESLGQIFDPDLTRRLESAKQRLDDLTRRATIGFSDLIDVGSIVLEQVFGDKLAAAQANVQALERPIAGLTKTIARLRESGQDSEVKSLTLELQFYQAELQKAIGLRDKLADDRLLVRGSSPEASPELQAAAREAQARRTAAARDELRAAAEVVDPSEALREGLRTLADSAEARGFAAGLGAAVKAQFEQVFRELDSRGTASIDTGGRPGPEFRLSTTDPRLQSDIKSAENAIRARQRAAAAAQIEQQVAAEKALTAEAERRAEAEKKTADERTRRSIAEDRARTWLKENAQRLEDANRALRESALTDDARLASLRARLKLLEQETAASLAAAESDAQREQITLDAENKRLGLARDIAQVEDRIAQTRLRAEQEINRLQDRNRQLRESRLDDARRLEAIEARIAELRGQGSAPSAPKPAPAPAAPQRAGPNFAPGPPTVSPAAPPTPLAPAPAPTTVRELPPGTTQFTRPSGEVVTTPTPVPTAPPPAVQEPVPVKIDVTDPVPVDVKVVPPPPITPEVNAPPPVAATITAPPALTPQVNAPPPVVATVIPPAPITPSVSAPAATPGPVALPGSAPATNAADLERENQILELEQQRDDLREKIAAREQAAAIRRRELLIEEIRLRREVLEGRPDAGRAAVQQQINTLVDQERAIVADILRIKNGALRTADEQEKLALQEDILALKRRLLALGETPQGSTSSTEDAGRSRARDKAAEERRKADEARARGNFDSARVHEERAGRLDQRAAGERVADPNSNEGKAIRDAQRLSEFLAPAKPTPKATPPSPALAPGGIPANAADVRLPGETTVGVPAGKSVPPVIRSNEEARAAQDEVNRKNQAARESAAGNRNKPTVAIDEDSAKRIAKAITDQFAVMEPV